MFYRLSIILHKPKLYKFVSINWNYEILPSEPESNCMQYKISRPSTSQTVIHGVAWNKGSRKARSIKRKYLSNDTCLARFSDTPNKDKIPAMRLCTRITVPSLYFFRWCAKGSNESSLVHMYVQTVFLGFINFLTKCLPRTCFCDWGRLLFAI